jgi:hypothetical protein
LAEFWSSTPRSYRALADRVLERERRADARFGTVAAVAANLMGGKRGGGQFSPADFFPSLAEAPAAGTRPTGPSDEQILAGLTGWAALCGTPVLAQGRARP